MFKLSIVFSLKKKTALLRQVDCSVGFNFLDEDLSIVYYTKN